MNSTYQSGHQRARSRSSEIYANLACDALTFFCRHLLNRISQQLLEQPLLRLNKR